MEIGNFRVVRIDSLNMSFEEKQKDKNGNDKWKRVGGYYGDLSSLCKGLGDYIINANIENTKDVDALADLLKDIKELYARVVYGNRV